MAQLPGRACRWPGCPNVTRHKSGYCEEHQAAGRRQTDQQLEERRGSASARGYDNRWEKFREWFLRRPGNQICHRCLERGEITKAELVHHIEPVRERPDLRLVESNCIPLCRACHELEHRQAD